MRGRDKPGEPVADDFHGGLATGYRVIVGA
jgi:hypothetical protein